MTSEAEYAPIQTALRACELEQLDEQISHDALVHRLRGLASLAEELGDVERVGLRDAAVEVLVAAGYRSPASLVDAALGTHGHRDERGLQGQQLVLTDPDPWCDPVDGQAVVRELVDVVRRYVALPEEAAVAAALWAIHTHCHDASLVSPILAITSPEKECGKTITLTVLGALVPRSLPASSITPAAVFRAVEMYRPTLLVDEADSFLKEQEGLRNILNSGHHRAGAVVVRTVGDDYEPRTFSTWAPKAIAMIGTLPPTLESRSIGIRLRRRRPDEEVEPIRLDRLGKLEPLRMKLARWAKDNLETLRESDPPVPPKFRDRAADNWRPLFAIADVVGAEWPERARQAAVVLSETGDDLEAAPRVQLLADIREVFDQKGAVRMFSPQLVEALVEQEDRLWAEWRGGKAMTTVQLARLLRPFGVRPKQVRIAGEKGRGYERADFEDAFSRYLPAEPVHPVQPESGALSGPPTAPYADQGVPDASPARSPGPTGAVPGVPDGEDGAARQPLPEHVVQVVEYVHGHPGCSRRQVLESMPCEGPNQAEIALDALVATGASEFAHLRREDGR
jgi:putative DNA primase/helicase